MNLATEPKSLKQWVDLYTKKTGDKVELLPGCKLVYLANRGFCIYHFDGDGKMIVAYEVCGDGMFWRDYCEILASELGAECIAALCTRPVKAYIRAFGWEILNDELVNGQHRYHCQDKIGRLVILTYKGTTEDGNPQYYVTHYLNKKYTEGSDLIGKK